MFAAAWLTLAAVTGSLASAQLAPSPNGLDLEVSADRVTLNADAVLLTEIVRALGARSGFEVHMAGNLTDRVTVSFTRLPLTEVLDRLIGTLDRVIVYGPPAPGATNPSVQRLWLFASEGVTGSGQANDNQLAAPDELDSAAVKRRSHAILRLANAGATEETLETLIQALHGDQAPLVRNRAAIALGALRDARAIPALEAALNDENASVRAQATQAFGQIGGERVTLILGEILLQDTDTRQRVAAAIGLQKLGTELARSFLDAAVEDPDEQVRNAVRRPQKRTSANADTPSFRSGTTGSESTW